MLILAGVSLNALVGDNGIITNAQNASVSQYCAIISEYLGERYIEFASNDNSITSSVSNKIEYLSTKIDDLLLKDGIRNYIIKDGKVYYLLNKKALPEDIQAAVKGGDSDNPDDFLRLIDVYGVTKNLDVYYINSDISQTYGKFENYDIDPDLVSYIAVSDTTVAGQLVTALKEQKGITTTADNIKLAQLMTLSNFTLNGEGITKLNDLTALSDCTSLTSLTLENVNTSSLTGIEKLTKLSSLYLKNVTCDNYSALCSVWSLTKLYIYMPSDKMNEIICNQQVANLGNGLASATNLKDLEYFGISGESRLLEYNGSLSFGDVSRLCFASFYNSLSYPRSVLQLTGGCSNLTNLGEVNTGLGKFNDKLKETIKYVYLYNNSFTNVNALKDFKSIITLDLFGCSNLYDVSGLTNHTNLSELTLQNCDLGSKDINGAVVDEYRFTGCTGLTKLSISANKKLTSLKGLEDCVNLEVLAAYWCTRIK